MEFKVVLALPEQWFVSGYLWSNGHGLGFVDLVEIFVRQE